MAEMINCAFCPIKNKEIDIAYCIELQMIADNEVLPTEEDKHLSKKDYEQCRQCKTRTALNEE